MEPNPQPAEFSGRVLPVPGRRPKSGAGRVPGRRGAVLDRTRMCLLGYWRTGLLVLAQGSWYYLYVSYTIQNSEPWSTQNRSRPQP